MTGKQLAEHRERLGLSQNAAAAKVGITPASLRNHERPGACLAMIHQRAVDGYAELYGVTPADIRRTAGAVTDGRGKYRRTKKARKGAKR